MHLVENPSVLLYFFADRHRNQGHWRYLGVVPVIGLRSYFPESEGGQKFNKREGPSYCFVSQHMYYLILLQTFAYTCTSRYSFLSYTVDLFSNANKSDMKTCFRFKMYTTLICLLHL